MKKREGIRIMLCIALIICCAAMGTSADILTNMGMGDSEKIENGEHRGQL